MNKYNTKQQELILNYLKQNHEKDLSAQMIVNYIIKKINSVAKLPYIGN